MKVNKIILSLVSVLFLSSCEYEQSEIALNSNTGYIYLINNQNRYISHFRIIINDSVEFNYPISNDTIIRDKLNFVEYFDFKLNKLYDKSLMINLTTGKRDGNLPFDVCYEKILNFKKDTLYKFNCYAR